MPSGTCTAPSSRRSPTSTRPWPCSWPTSTWRPSPPCTPGWRPPQPSVPREPPADDRRTRRGGCSPPQRLPSGGLMRQGRVFRRCSSCGARIEGRRCPKCGGDTFSWAFVVDVSPPGSPTRRQRRGGGFRTKADAQAALNKLQVETAEGRHISPSRLTVGQYLDEWLPGVRGEIRPSTYGTYELAVRRLKPLIGDVLMQELTYRQVKAAYGQLAAG